MEPVQHQTLDEFKYESEYKKYRQKHGLASKQLTGKTPVQWTLGGLCASFDALKHRVSVNVFVACIVLHGNDQLPSLCSSASLVVACPGWLIACMFRLAHNLVVSSELIKSKSMQSLRTTFIRRRSS